MHLETNDLPIEFPHIMGDVRVENQPRRTGNPPLSAGIQIITQLTHLLVLWGLPPRSHMAVWRGLAFLISVSRAVLSVEYGVLNIEY